MKADARRDAILDALRTDGRVRTRSLVELLAVSEMTVRRDLDVLAAHGLLVKVHGGAAAAPRPTGAGLPLGVRSHLHRAEKAAIARAALPLLAPGQTVGLTDGSTTTELARLLRERHAPGTLTVVTSSVAVAATLDDPRSVVLTGGRRDGSDALVGPLALDAVRTLNLDLALVGADGVDVRAGVTAVSREGAEVLAAFADMASRLVVLADHSKVGVVAPYPVLPLERVDVLVTGAECPLPDRTALQAAGPEVLVARPESSE